MLKQNKKIPLKKSITQEQNEKITHLASYKHHEITEIPFHTLYNGAMKRCLQLSFFENRVRFRLVPNHIGISVVCHNLYLLSFLQFDWFAYSPEERILYPKVLHAENTSCIMSRNGIFSETSRVNLRSFCI